MISIIVLAAGQGTRMLSKTPKILHQVAGKAIIHHVLDTVMTLNPQEIVVVLSPNLCSATIVGGRSVKVAIQESPLGTADAVRAGLEKLSAKDGKVLILCGDVPLIQAPDLLHLLSEHQSQPTNSLTVLGMRLKDPRSYGRIVAEEKSLIGIVEYKDATLQERQIDLCNTGIMITPTTILRTFLPQITCNNAAKEYYLTDIIALAKNNSVNSYVVEAANPDMWHGINDRLELATAEHHYQTILREKIMRSGVTLIDPETVYFSHDTIVGKDTIIYPNVVFGEKVRVGEDVVIYPSCHLVKTRLDNHTKVGPFAHLRNNTVLEEGAEIGNFVEVKQSTVGRYAKAKHLAYLGDATVGEKANIGAGVITCNYNGFVKHKTNIGSGAFIGSNSSLIAPVDIGEDAIIGAGSVIKEDVPEGALGISRSKQEIRTNWANSFHENNNKNKG